MMNDALIWERGGGGRGRVEKSTLGYISNRAQIASKIQKVYEREASQNWKGSLSNKYAGSLTHRLKMSPTFQRARQDVCTSRKKLWGPLKGANQCPHGR